ncbi:HEAT repeat domain-containing protein [Nostoc sp. FACHB-152]|uniref:HEAT repeat domain-containing protein n=1 Tax=unclassified Nostoc TaxID=2593658 RepID=UPI001689916F|nr:MULTISPECIES: HEAT repeat domain-containing protein [unclassified Nostoc]MBD2449241.1 HEAT repeat domain-containing protein [Nostoc sp. FACHB-152]MBD2466390.1 HEAT repeat domain-containing protein [Nostoc sp. FACHB-145]
MVVDWLAVWGITQAVGFAFKPIFEDLAKDVAKDWAKDLLKSIPKNILQQLTKEDIEVAAGKALKEFLQLMQQELEDSDIEESELQQYTQPLNQFIHDQTLTDILSNTFQPDCQSLDTQVLSHTWYKINLPNLPPKFDWERLTKRYLKKVKAIIRESDKLRPILDSQNLEQVKNSLQELTDIAPDFDLPGYQEGLRERYGNLKLDSLDTTGYAYNELKLWRMFIAQNVREVHQVLPQVHELPKEHLRKLSDSNQLEAEILLEELEGYRRVYFGQPIVSVLDVINNPIYKYLVILGDPGSGKSTLLQYLALTWAETPLTNVISLPIPLLIELRTYIRRRENNECNNFLDFFHKCSGTVHHLNQNQLHEHLKAGNALVMFDGLDEVFELAKREDVITDIHRFTNVYPNVRVIVTSRVIGYKPQRLRDAEFRHFMLQDLDTEQIQDFINRWHELTFIDSEDKLRKRERLQRAIDTSKSIAELAGNPLLLTMMAILNRNQELPRDRATLYEQSSRVLLHQWDVERALVEDSRLDPKTIDYKDKQAMLRHVAYHMQTSPRGLNGNLISVSDLEKILIKYLKNIEFENPVKVARVMINQLRVRNFMLCFVGADYYAFVHRTFLEYFCAWEFVWQFKESQILSISELNNEVFGKHWRYETWHEVLRLITGMIEPKFVCEILNYLMAQNGEQEKFINLFLAAKCLAEVRNRVLVATTASKLLNRIKELTQYDLSYYYQPYRDEEETKLVQEIRTQAVLAVATTWKDDSDTLLWLKQLANADEHEDVRRAAVQELARNFKDHADTLLWLKQQAIADNNWTVRQVALQELVRNFKDDPEILPMLKQRATTDENEYVRQAAVQELARGFKEKPDILAWLQQRVTADSSGTVRQVAVQELVRAFKDNFDILTWLKQRITDDDWTVRQAAVQELVRGFKEDSETLPILKQRAITDENEYVRQAAVQELARTFKDDAETFSILKQCATTDKYSGVRQTAVEELARGFKEEPEVLNWLKQRITADNDQYVRRAAVQELARSFKNDPETITILQQRAIADQYSDVRRAAVQELARGFKDHPDTLSILKQRASNDDNEYVRRTALQELARDFTHDPDILPILKKHATSDKYADVRQAALQELARIFKDDPDILAILKKRATADKSANVRQLALQELARGFKDNPDIFEVFYTCAVNDPFEREYSFQDNPRQVALETITEQYLNHPQTLPLLRDKAANDPDEQVREFAKKKLAELG